MTNVEEAQARVHQALPLASDAWAKLRRVYERVTLTHRLSSGALANCFAKRRTKTSSPTPGEGQGDHTEGTRRRVYRWPNKNKSVTLLEGCSTGTLGIATILETIPGALTLNEVVDW